MVEPLAGETELLVGFFDLAGYARWCRGRAPGEALALMTALFARAGAAVARSGGRLVKAMGDAGLFAYPSADADGAVRAAIELKRDSDAWLADSGYPGAMTVKMTLGPVACGPVGAPGAERFDIYGETVNRAALLEGPGVVIAPALWARLSPGLEAMFSERRDSGAFVLKSADFDPGNGG
jgi:class 3 adenylate cyclase